MAWNCLQTEERLSDYLDGQLERGDRQALETHAKDCTACGALVAKVSALVSGMQRIEPVEVPPGLIVRILVETTGRTAERAQKPRLSWLAAFLQPRLAFGALTVCATFVILFHATGLDLRKISASDLNPVSVYRATDRQAHLVFARGVKFVNDLRVVYEIQSRLQGRPETPPANERRDSAPSSPPQEPKSDRQLKNYLDHSRAPLFAAELFVSLPGGRP